MNEQGDEYIIYHEFEWIFFLCEELCEELIKIFTQILHIFSYISLIQRWHKNYPKFPELYSHRINSLIMTALKYLTEH